LPPGPRSPETSEPEGMGLLKEWPLADSRRYGASGLTMGGGQLPGGGITAGSRPAEAGEVSGGAKGDAGGLRIPQAVLRKQFLDTALWLPSVVTNSSGAAVVRVKWP